jgi:hypothetical protein
MTLPADTGFLPLAVTFVEKAGAGLGLGRPEALALTLATEELFSYLCGLAAPEQEVGIRCTSGGYYVRADFDFPVEAFNMKAFNLTATVSFDDEASLMEMGLLIAARSVDRFQVAEGGDGVQLTLVKEKVYPEPEGGALPPVPPLETFSVRPPAAEELKILVRLVADRYPSHLMPPAFRYPGKVVDMVEGGEYRAAAAFGPGGEVGGGILWHWTGSKTVECFGPYLFDQPSESPMAAALLEACLGAIARTHAVGLVSRLPTGQLPSDWFEPLGTVTLPGEGEGPPLALEARFRQMQEDPGATAWCHPDLEPFLRDEYRRLVLPRDLRTVTDLGEGKADASVLSAEVDRGRNMITLRPIRTGRDAEENLVNHLRLFEREPGTGLFFEMDTALPWQADFTPFLLAHGFAPRMVLPYAGTGDLVLFQLSKEAS